MTDLDAYFRRVGYEGPRKATLAVLRDLQRLHPAAIPFEAIDVLLGRGVDLAPEVVDAKLLRGGRGGYCFEQNGLFRRVLTRLGFEVEALLARSVWMRPADQPPGARTHMVLKVRVERQWWLADVGFGAAVLTAPIRLHQEAAQQTPHDRYRLVRAGDGRRLEMQLGDRWAPVYDISFAPQADADLEAGNWFTSMHPSSHFRHNLMVARSTPEGRFSLLHNRLAVRRQTGEVLRRRLTVDGLTRVLPEVFGLAVQPDWHAVLERAVAAGEEATEGAVAA